ncbi:hypothetical protein [Nocardioides guangzhouensis]|uniref:hypothetical protein n=1 Tax=Nocardioides guangzhouensis TaxID=2497878 RepID=UPI0014384887|nr:hypothetical protein [Nocardioides guangzhouensis]
MRGAQPRRFGVLRLLRDVPRLGPGRWRTGARIDAGRAPPVGAAVRTRRDETRRTGTALVGTALAGTALVGTALAGTPRRAPDPHHHAPRATGDRHLPQLRARQRRVPPLLRQVWPRPRRARTFDDLRATDVPRQALVAALG